MKKFILIGLLVFIGSLIIYLPANNLTKFLPDTINTVNVSGTLWEGAAQDVFIDNFSYGSIQWKLNPKCFFKFSLCVEITQNSPQIESSFFLEQSNHLIISNLLAQGDASTFDTLLKAYGVSALGSFDVDITHLELKDLKPISMDGEITFNSLVLNGAIQVALGEVEALSTTQVDLIDIALENEEGQFDFNGNVQLYNDSSYVTDIKVAPNYRSNETILNSLEFLGRPNGDGSYTIAQKGRL